MHLAITNVFVLILSLLAPAPADSPKELALKPGDKIVAIGDSITAQGLYLRDIDAVLAQQYPDLKIAKVVNKGISGQVAVDLHQMFLDTLAKKPKDVNGNWLTADGVHPKELGGAIMAIGVLRALGVPDAKIAATTPPATPVHHPQTKPASKLAAHP